MSLRRAPLIELSSAAINMPPELIGQSTDLSKKKDYYELQLSIGLYRKGRCPKVTIL